MKAKIEINSYIIESIKNIILAQEIAAKKGDAKSVKSLTVLLNKELDRVKDITFEICDQPTNQPPNKGENKECEKSAISKSQ